MMTTTTQRLLDLAAAAPDCEDVGVPGGGLTRHPTGCVP